MKENFYDNQPFFDKYSAMARSQKGLEGAGEWPTLKTMLPDFKNKVAMVGIACTLFRMEQNLF